MAEEQFLEKMKYELDNKFEVFDTAQFYSMRKDTKDHFVYGTLDDGTYIKMAKGEKGEILTDYIQDPILY